MRRKDIAGAMRALVMCAAVTWASPAARPALGQVSPLFTGADLSTFTSLDGSVRVQAEGLGGGSYLVTYGSPRGTLEILVSPGSLEVASFSVRIAPAGTGIAGEYVLTVETPLGAASTRVVYDPSGVTAGCDGPAQVDDDAAVGQLLGELARFREGTLLREARAFILEKLRISEGMLRDASHAAACQYLGPPEGGPPNDLFSWTCLRAVFNQIAAGAAMVGGCGTPACGPAYRSCCTSGVAWYTSAFIGTWTSCS